MEYEPHSLEDVHKEALEKKEPKIDIFKEMVRWLRGQNNVTEFG